jgi:hypothetical protein
MRRETIHTENSYKFTDQGIVACSMRPVLRSEGHGKTWSRLVHPYAWGISCSAYETMRRSRSENAGTRHFMLLSCR